MHKINRIYIHVPFCSSKCGYCTFHSIPAPDESLIDFYFKKLEREFDENKEKTDRLESIFIGGGTPGYLSPVNLEKLFTLVKNNFSFSLETEISIECNPESIIREKIKIIESFANRISLGIQSFNEKHRKTLGRAGDIKKIREAIDLLRDSKINNVSCDIIYGIPGQTVKDFENDIKTVVKHGVFKHFSAYALTLEEGSHINNLYSKREKADSETVSADMWELIPEIINGSGFKRYEISNYSQKGKECEHNVDIWFGGRYLGFGPTAASFDGNVRWTQKTLYEWLENEPAVYDSIPESDRMNEIFLMGLRTVFGWEISPETGKERFKIIGPYNNSYSISSLYVKNLKEKLLHLKSQNLLKITGSKDGSLKVIPTEKGLSFWNEIALQLV